MAIKNKLVISLLTVFTLLLLSVMFGFAFLLQIEGFDVKHVDEYHLTGITMDMYVQWEHRPPTSTEGRGENRNEARGEGRAKPQHRNDAPNSEGLVRFVLPNSVTVLILSLLPLGFALTIAAFT